MLYVHTLAFNNLETVAGAVDNYIETRGDYPQKYLLIDCRYPLVEDWYRERALKYLAEKAGGTYVRLPSGINGVAQGWTYAWNEVKGGDDDILFGFDPDVRMQSKDWAWALSEGFANAPDAGVILMRRLNFREHERGTREVNAGMVSLMEFDHLVAWSCGAYHGRFMKKVRGVISQDNPIYGYIEHWSQRKLKEFGQKWYILRDYYDDHIKSPDALYTSWKQVVVRNKTTLPFREWLISQGHLRDTNLNR